MKNKLVCVLLIIVLVLGLLVGGAAGLLWYRDNHIFVEGKAYSIHATSLDLRQEDISFAHYDTLHAQLPQCQILWNVPFQNGKFPSDSTTLQIQTLTEEDVGILLGYFPMLTTLQAAGSDAYDLLESFQEQRPGCTVVYQVDIGGTSFAPDSTELTLSEGSYDLEVLTANLVHLPQVSRITFEETTLTLEQLRQFRETFPEVEVLYSVELLGQVYDQATTQLDLSRMTSQDVDTVLQKLPMLPELETVELESVPGESQLTKQDVRTLIQAAPETVFHYSFDFFGNTLSTATEEVHIKNTKIGDENEEEIRLALDLLTNCKRFVLEYCQVSNELMAQLREDYRDRTKVVWRVQFGKGSCMTDVDAIRAVYDLVDDNSENLKYCEDVKYIDFGHNEYLDGCEFVAGMPNLEYIILSGSPIKDLSPFANCKKLKFLEIAFCGYIEDLSPLANCTQLEKLNIANTKVSDLSPLENLPLTHLTVNQCKVSQADREAFAAAHPECLVKFDGNQYGEGWRYTMEDHNKPYPFYQMLRDIFEYETQAFNHTGKYTDITLEDYVQAQPEPAQTAPEPQTETTPETVPETTPETAPAA